MKAPHLLILMTISQIDGFEKNCPMSSQWGFRSRVICNTTLEYYCLFDDNSKLNREFCRAKPDFLAPGNKYVIRGNLDGEDCDKDSYQPFIYRTNETSRCALLKSKCKEEGQIIYRNGSTTTDRSCRCDYTRHYAFVVQPQNSCYCDLSMEDCSCYIKQCPSRTHLSADYVCTSDYIWDKQSICESIKVSRYFNPYYNFKNMSIVYINVTSAGIYILSRLCVGLETSQDPPKMAVEPLSCDPPLEGKSMKSWAEGNELKIELKNNDGYKSDTVSLTPSSLTGLAEPGQTEIQVTSLTEDCIQMIIRIPNYRKETLIEWRKKTPNSKNYETLLLQDNKYEFIPGPTSSLQIRNSNSDDAGSYMCVVSKQNGKEKKSKPVTIERPKVHSKKETFACKKGEKIILECVCFSVLPINKIAWFKSDFETTHTELKYEVEALEDCKYSCVVANAVGSSETEIKVTVNARDKKSKADVPISSDKDMTQAQVELLLANEEEKVKQAAINQIEKPLRVHITGKSGVGKSSTANNIIEKEEFCADSSAKAVAQKCQFTQGKISTRDLLLSDTPGTPVRGENPKQTINYCVKIKVCVLI